MSDAGPVAANTAASPTPASSSAPAPSPQLGSDTSEQPQTQPGSSGQPSSGQQPLDDKDVELGLEQGEEEQLPLKDRMAQKALAFKEEMQARDPVKKGRCTLGTAAFAGIGFVGLFFFGFGCAEEDIWEIISSLFLTGLSGYALFFLGGDPCLIDAFREQVNLFHRENRRFKDSNDGLSTKLVNLGHVSDDLEEVKKKMRSDVDAATNLLNDMERFSAMQTVAAVVNQFFAADWDGSGHINGDEAQIFIPQLSSLWALAPNFDPERLIVHVRDNGLTLTQLSVLLDCLVADDRDKCLEELEKLIAEPPPLPLSAEGREVKLAAQGEEPAHLEELYEEASMENVRNALGAIRMPQWLSQAAAEDQKAKDDEALKPWFEIGPLQVWSILHLALMICSVAGIVFTVAAFVVFEVTNIVGSLVGVCLASGLMAASRLIEVLRALRVEVGVLHGENDRLECIHEDLTGKVGRLSRLQKGYQVLQAECGGNVEKARELIHKSNTNTKMSAMAVVTRIFKEADVNRNNRIDGEEVDNFVKQLELVFGVVGGWDAQKARVIADGLGIREMKSLVDAIITIEPPAPPAAKDASQGAEVAQGTPEAV